MKLKQILAGFLAGALAFAAVPFAASAEDSTDEWSKYISLEKTFTYANKITLSGNVNTGNEWKIAAGDEIAFTVNLPNLAASLDKDDAAGFSSAYIRDVVITFGGADSRTYTYSDFRAGNAYVPVTVFFKAGYTAKDYGDPGTINNEPEFVAGTISNVPFSITYTIDTYASATNSFSTIGADFLGVYNGYSTQSEIENSYAVKAAAMVKDNEINLNAVKIAFTAYNTYKEKTQSGTTVYTYLNNGVEESVAGMSDQTYVVATTVATVAWAGTDVTTQPTTGSQIGTTYVGTVAAAKTALTPVGSTNAHVGDYIVTDDSGTLRYSVITAATWYSVTGQTSAPNSGAYNDILRSNSTQVTNSGGYCIDVPGTVIMWSDANRPAASSTLTSAQKLNAFQTTGIVKLNKYAASDTGTVKFLRDAYMQSTEFTTKEMQEISALCANGATIEIEFDLIKEAKITGTKAAGTMGTESATLEHAGMDALFAFTLVSTKHVGNDPYNQVSWATKEDQMSIKFTVLPEYIFDGKFDWNVVQLGLRGIDQRRVATGFTFTVKSGEPAGKWTTADALAALKLANKITKADGDNAKYDLNKNGSVDVGDALLILKSTVA